MKKLKISSLQEMAKFSKDFLSGLYSLENSNEATIVLLQGDLGSGKTTFTQNCAKILGIKGTVNSPTFVIQKKYEIKGHQIFKNLFHIDAYRLNGGEELKILGWQEIISNPKNLVFIEWPEKVESVLLKHNTKKLKFVFIDENTREISF